MEYEIHDNGTTPFKVKLLPNNILCVYKRIYRSEDYDEIENIKYEKLFDGETNKGSSILLLLSNNEYMYINSSIYKFKTHNNEIIHKFISDIGNSDVVYAYAFGENNIYLLTEESYIANEYIAIDSGKIYEQYYNLMKKARRLEDKIHRHININKRIMLKVIHNRCY